MIRIAPTVALMALLAAAAQAQVPTRRDTLLADIRIAASDLRNLVVAQEAFYSDNGRYATTLDSAKYLPSTGSRIRFTKVAPNGWGAVLMRERLRGGCVIWVNLDPADRPRTADGLDAEEGAPRCDTPLELADAGEFPGRPSAIRLLTADETRRVAMYRARADLRNLVTAQEAYFADNAKYARDLSLLRWPSAGSTITLVVAEDRGWAATATRPDMQGSCVMWVNVAEDKRPRTSPSGRTAREGEAVCDGSTAAP